VFLLAELSASFRWWFALLLEPAVREKELLQSLQFLLGVEILPGPQPTSLRRISVPMRPTAARTATSCVKTASQG